MAEVLNMIRHISMTVRYTDANAWSWDDANDQPMKTQPTGHSPQPTAHIHTMTLLADVDIQLFSRLYPDEGQRPHGAVVAH